MNPGDLKEGKVYRYKLTKEPILFIGDFGFDNYYLKFRLKNMEEIELESCEVEEMEGQHFPHER